MSHTICYQYHIYISATFLYGLRCIGYDLANILSNVGGLLLFMTG